MRTFSSLLFCCLTPLLLAKVCWKSCKEESKTEQVLQNLDIAGCHRRSTYPEYEDFLCEGNLGPPCTAVSGDTININMRFVNPGVANLTQSAGYLVTSFIELPWPGMDRDGCKYLDRGSGCGNKEERLSEFSMPVFIESIYPQGKYDLKYQLFEKLEDGREEELVCALFTLRIV
eukprot:GFUD01011509.1.p1 GENE.GFUD01011509.1~~GFUD01011509.1.p1  ORF type:complete len:174 (+),score=44.01 GFUD01011509.1:475-996(+)